MPAKELHYQWEWELPAPAEVLWPLVSDTNRFNRDTGLPPVQDLAEHELENARRQLRVTVRGVSVEWEELPFEWVRPWRFGVVRRYSRGPLAEMRVAAELVPVGEGDRTLLRYHVVARPVGLLGRLAAVFQIGLVSRRTFEQVFRRYAAAALDPAIALPERPRTPAGASDLLDAWQEQGASAQHLMHALESSDDLSLSRMRPYTFAKIWGLDRTQVLVDFLRATRAGILDLRWQVLCPLCRGVKTEAETLEQLRTRGVHCGTCLIDFSGDFDRSVELSFRPNPRVRRVEQSGFCVAGPQITPHVVVQQLLAPGAGREVAARLEPGRYRLRVHGDAGGIIFDAREGTDAGPVSCRISAEGWSAGTPESISTSPTLLLENSTVEERLVMLERTAWADEAVTAADVTALKEFRDLFSNEVLAAGDFVEVGTVTLLFTDLKASTRLYRDVGDGPAFGRVMAHFAVLNDVVDAHSGFVVKTIGDAVMAVFQEPSHAVQAALEAAARLQSGDPEQRLVLKSGVHQGPCLVVTLSDRLDYFGTTVNMAARLGSLSQGLDVVTSEGVRSDPGVRKLVDGGSVEAHPFQGSIRGLDDDSERTLWQLKRP